METVRSWKHYMFFFFNSVPYGIQSFFAKYRYYPSTNTLDINIHAHKMQLYIYIHVSKLPIITKEV
jgi:hypothetical protein